MKRLAHYSQHFLRSPQLVKELVGHTSLKSTDTVYDIGAGSGVITSILAERCNTVVAIESEPRTAEKLRSNMAKYHNVSVREQDFLSLELPTRPYKVFANIPFHLSSAILRKLTEANNPPTDSYLIVQKQFANKLLPDHDGFTSQLGMQIGPRFAVRVRKPLRRTDYWPHPNVDTVLLEVKHRDEPLVQTQDEPAYRSLIERSFSDPKFFARVLTDTAMLPLGTKPSQLTLAQWLVLFQLLRQLKTRNRH